VYRYGRLLLESDILYRLREQSPLHLVVERLYGYANPLFEYHIVDHLLR
jgi:hypothetical protein